MVLFLALNGTSEAYAHAVMKPTELNAANIVLLSSSLLNVLLSIYLQPRIGPIGPIISNCVSMSLRLAYTLRFVLYQRLRDCTLPLASFLPSRGVFVALLTSSVVTTITSRLDMIKHLSAGLISVGGILSAIWLFERDAFASMMALKTRSKVD